jgi:phospholipid/cholesterol/gamma-HCH transport system substrate-binding protein
MKHSLLETSIGAVVLLVAGIFLIFSYSTAHQGESMMGGAYQLNAVFDNIGGLKVGDSVMISGVKVGAVDDIGLDDKLYRAKVSFYISGNIKLARDSSAKISSESLLGGKYLDVQPGGDENDLESGDVITMTQAPANLEDLLGRFIFSASETKKDSKADATPETLPAAASSIDTYHDDAHP